jgi:hypothetical protein
MGRKTRTSFQSKNAYAPGGKRAGSGSKVVYRRLLNDIMEKPGELEGEKEALLKRLWANVVEAIGERTADKKMTPVAWDATRWALDQYYGKAKESRQVNVTGDFFVTHVIDALKPAAAQLSADAGIEQPKLMGASNGKTVHNGHNGKPAAGA